MEEKREILDYLEENIRFFKDVDKKVFELLRKNKINNIEEYSIVTPLLKKISEYALVVNILEDEMDEISELYDNLGDILELCNQCDYLIQIFIEEGYKHPSINNYVNSINGISLRGDIFGMAYSLISKLLIHNDLELCEGYEDDEEDSDISIRDRKQVNQEFDYIINLRNSISIIDEPTNELLDFMFKYILFSGREKGLDEVGILNYLVSYANMKIKIIMMINDYNLKIINSNGKTVLLNSISEENFYPTFEFNFADMILALSDMFINLEKVLENDMTDKNFKIISKLKEAYHLYQSYRYSYLKNSEEEGKFLNKRKNY